MQGWREVLWFVREMCWVEYPSQIRKVLTLNLCNSAAGPCNIGQSIDEIENFMRNSFTKSMLQKTEKMSEYLGLFTNNQKNFQFLSGQRRILSLISDCCTGLFTQKAAEKNDSKTSEHSITQATTKQLSDDDEKFLRSMYDTLYDWMGKQSALSEVV